MNMSWINKFKYIKGWYFIVGLLLISNPIPSLTNAMEANYIFSHYITLMPNIILFIYCYYVTTRFDQISYMWIIRKGINYYRSECKNTILSLACIYIMVSYLYVVITMEYYGVLPLLIIFIFFLLNALMILVGSLSIFKSFGNIKGLLIAMLLNFLFHYIFVLKVVDQFVIS